MIGIHVDFKPLAKVCFQGRDEYQQELGVSNCDSINLENIYM